MTIRRAVVAILTGVIAGGIAAGLLIALRQPSPASVLSRGASSESGWAIFVLFGALMGFTYAALFPEPSSYVESAMSGTAYGVLWWWATSLTLIPLVTRQAPDWSALSAGATFPAFAAALFQGAMIGLGYHVAWAVAASQPVAPQPVTRTEAVTRIVVVGGGFSGVTAAQRLERLFAGDPAVEITLVSGANYMLFTPMLIEVTTSVIEPRHIAPPLRVFFRWVNVVRGEVQSVDLDRRVLKMAGPGGEPQPDIPFDHLVLALGTVPNYYDLPGVEENAFTFKTLRAAIELRNRVIDMLEAADDEPDSTKRKAMLTFVVAGGGFAGTELVGALNDFIRSALVFYPNLRQEDVSLILIHSSRRILPELSEGLAAYALAKLEARGVTCKCDSRLAGAEPGYVILANSERIEARTLVWTAGNIPHPLVRTLAGTSTERSAIKTDATFAVLGATGVWAIGDCAYIPDAKTGQPALATAQHALVEGPAVARNIHRAVRGRKPKPFHYTSLGSVALLGHHVAAAEIKGMKFSGLLAWVMWRMVYLYRLPTLERKLRVAMDWLVDMFFPRDIVQTMGAPRPARAPVEAPAQGEEVEA
jgi:NADH:ubiquinone reductase (H+-translocating)